MKVETSDELRAFLRALAPEPRRKILQELDKVESGDVKIKALEFPPLEGFYKVKTGPYRIICAVDLNKIYALIGGYRASVYETTTPNFLWEVLEKMKSR